MVLTAQQVAPDTMYGAVEVATAFFRWAIRSPNPPPDEVEALRSLFPGDVVDAAVTDLKSDFAANPNPSNGNVPDGTPFYLSTVNGLWLVSPGATSDQVTVSVSATYVIDGALSPTKTAAETFTMEFEEMAWRISALAEADAAKIAAGGTTFTAGC